MTGIYPIYTNGSVQVVPHITLIKIVVGGRVLDTYTVDQLEEAIRTADEMAEKLPIAA